MRLNTLMRPGWGRTLRTLVVLTLGGLVLSACGGGGSSTAAGTSTSTATSMSAMAQLGEKIFKDTSLSVNGQSCATCHNASNGHGPVFNSAVPTSSNHFVELGGTSGTTEGTRSAPSIRYLVYNTAFYIAADGTPTGGFFWDGRATSLADQAAGPFLNAREMANDSKADVITKLAATSYAAEFKALFGANIFDDADAAFLRITLALQAYQKEDSDFAPFTSKYDAYLRGTTTLSAAELRGLALFNSSSKGNCAACHPSAKGSDGSHPLFTDFSYDSLGVPRNWNLAVNADTSYYDLGLCDSAAVADLTEAVRKTMCGLFKVPSLRNVALRKSFFHNGRFTDLTTALTFYVQRDTNPELWYLKQDGSVDYASDGVTVNKYNDLPSTYRSNVNTSEAPYNRSLGDSPALSTSEIADLVTFLNTLTDGWSN
jgi:cytochrome c peroxidase